MSGPRIVSAVREAPLACAVGKVIRLLNLPGMGESAFQDLSAVARVVPE